MSPVILLSLFWPRLGHGSLVLSPGIKTLSLTLGVQKLNCWTCGSPCNFSVMWFPPTFEKTTTFHQKISLFKETHRNPCLL